jgi:hypothetical protein
MTDDRAAEGVEHLRAAALELIAAARAFLDVAEDLVTDPDRVSGTLATLATLIDGPGRAPRGRQRADRVGERHDEAGPHDPDKGPGTAADAPAGDTGAAADPGARAASSARLRRIDLS